MLPSNQQRRRPAPPSFPLLPLNQLSHSDWRCTRMCVCVYVPSSGLSIIATNVNVPDMQMLRRIVGVLCRTLCRLTQAQLPSWDTRHTTAYCLLLQICVYIIAF